MMITIAVAVASSSLYGFGGKDDRGDRGAKGDRQDRSAKYGKRGDKKNMKRPPKQMYLFMSAVSNQDLSKEQRASVRKVMFETRENRIKQREDSKVSAIKFDKDRNFDKKFFIDDKTKLLKKMITQQANTIEKVFAILDDKQKQAVIQEMSSKQNMKNSGKRDKRKNKGKNKKKNNNKNRDNKK